MKQKIKIDKPIQIIEKSEIKKANDYCYRTTIPKKLIDLLPQLKEDKNAKVIYNIKQTKLDEFECYITFEAKGLTIENEIEMALDNDQAATKEVEKKTPANTVKNDAGNKLDPHKFEDVPLQDGKYTIKVTSPKRPKLRIVGSTIKDEIGIKEISIQVTYKSEDEVQEIIDNLVSCENPSANKLNEIVNSYKSEQYRT